MRLLAIDLGLRTGFALYEDGRLVAHRSTRFPSRSAIKSAAWSVLREFGPLDEVVAEGDRLIGELWQKVAEKQNATFRLIGAETWRDELLYAREQRGSSVAKQSAVELAHAVIEDHGAPRAYGELNDDVAEAILVGLWAVGGELPR